MRPLNKWTDFLSHLLRNAEGVDGGGTGDVGSGADAGAGGADSVAGSADPTPPATFLTEAKAPGEGETAKEGEAKAAEAPAAFDAAALTLPEGMELPEELGKGFAEILSDAALSPQERGQKLVDLHASTLKGQVESMQTAFQEASLKQWTEMNDGWRKQIADLPEFKGNVDAEAGKVMQALKAVGAGDDFFKALDLTGAGNNPAILQVLHRLSKPFMEGGAVQGGANKTAARQPGARIYTSANQG